MKTTFTLSLLFLLVWSGYGQLDFTHWLPPMHSRSEAQITDHYLYLSTPSLEPFAVTLTNGAGEVLATPVISSGAPFIYEIANDDPSVVMIEDLNLNEVLTNHGIIASGPEKFYCNFRARSNLQATSVTCKGNAARGEVFRVGAMPQQFEHNMRNFTIGIMATEDNTTVNISDYDAGVEFFDVDGNILDDDLTFLLDSGQSYVLSGYNNIPANLAGFVGALVTANNPIVMNNGNWCGSICDAGGQDIGMDQSVPIEVLGTEYILVRGDGDAQMERPLVIAHTDGTAIFVNDVIEPIATINAGDFYLIPEMYYTGAGHENMVVNTSNPAYVYQPLGGTADRATPGLNFIPPISCAMTKEIDMIPSIDQIGDVNYNGAIILFTLAGATVAINGIPQDGGEPVIGAPEWETYKIVGFTGDVTITSTDRMAAGMFGFSGDAGFAGFYSGFDQIGFVDFAFEENCESYPVEFTDETVTYAEEIIAWDWDFGDGDVSEDVNPTHFYDDGGMYTVFLEVTTNLGCTDTISYPVNVREAPEAGFIATDICLGNELPFENTSIFTEGEITEWTWEFGDATTSAESDPSHDYADIGLYPVTLTVLGDNGCADEISSPVEVFARPVASFVTEDDCYYSTASFENLSEIEEGVISVHLWDFGDDTEEALFSPDHDYAEAGTYDVVLSVSSTEGCTDDTTITITRHAAPVAEFSIPNACLSLALEVENTSSILAPYTINEYQWKLGDLVLSAEEIPDLDFTEAGVYSLTLIATSEEGCMDSIENELQIYDQPTASFTVADDCVSEIADFTNTSFVSDGDLTSFEWDFGDAGASGEENPAHLYADAGEYEVALSVTSEYGCVGDTLISVERFAVPTALYTVSDDCHYNALNFENTSSIEAPYTISTYDWELEDGIVSTDESPEHIFSEAGTYMVGLTVTSENGCSAYFSLPVNAFPSPEPNFSATTVCANEGPTSFFNETEIFWGEISTYEWTFVDGAYSSEYSPSFEFGFSGEHFVKLKATSEEGCTDSISKPILVRVLPIADLSVSDATICGNDCVEFTSNSFSPVAEISTHTWWTETGLTGYGETIEFCFENYDSEESYVDVQLVASDIYGCSDTLYAEDLIHILPTPKAAFSTDPDEVDLLDPEVRFTNESLYADYYVWDFRDGSPTSSEVHPTHLYDTEPEVYEVLLFAYSDNEMTCVDTARKVIKILDELIYYVPNAFTPDGDSFNNDFVPVFVSGFDPYDYHLSIYNRWGEVLFESFNSEIGWDGTLGNNGLVTDGVYVWKIEFSERSTGKRIEEIGHVTLLR